MNFHRQGARQIHVERRTRILREHPEVRELFGNNPYTALAVVAVVVTQTFLAFWAAERSFPILVALAFTAGAVLNHASFVLVHECVHQLVFKSRAANGLLMLFSNLPFIMPTAGSFRKYHLHHHRSLGDEAWDADVPAPWEARMVGNASWRKALWLLFFPLFYGLRPRNHPNIPLWDRLTVANLSLQILYVAAFFYGGGAAPILYLGLSSVFAIGLHPLGGRWFQEHFEMTHGQESNSYYGPGNLISFNVGYHVEHHDLAFIPWNRLPQLRRIAGKHYDSLVPVHSWTGVVLRFIFDPGMSLYSRVLRPQVPSKVKGPMDDQERFLPKVELAR